MQLENRLILGKTCSPIVFVGHSEGAEVLPRTLELLINEKNPLVKKIRGVVLSGTPLDQIDDILKFQFGQEWLTTFWTAYKKKDQQKIYQQKGNGLIYWDDLLHSEALSKTLLRPGIIGAKIPFFFFHGVQDKYTSVSAIKAFETNNQHLRELERPALNLEVRYFDSDHALNETAFLQMIELVRNLIIKK